MGVNVAIKEAATMDSLTRISKCGGGSLCAIPLNTIPHSRKDSLFSLLERVSQNGETIGQRISNILQEHQVDLHTNWTR